MCEKVKVVMLSKSGCESKSKYKSKKVWQKSESDIECYLTLVLKVKVNTEAKK